MSRTEKGRLRPIANDTSVYRYRLLWEIHQSITPIDTRYTIKPSLLFLFLWQVPWFQRISFHRIYRKHIVLITVLSLSDSGTQ